MDNGLIRFLYYIYQVKLRVKQQKLFDDYTATNKLIISSVYELDKLVNSLTVEKIKTGISIQRDPILNTFSKTVFPYTGYGSGIKRVISINPDVKFINDIEKEEFKTIIPFQENAGVNLLTIIRVNPGKRTIERWLKELKELKDKNKIEFKGAPKTGGYYAK